MDAVAARAMELHLLPQVVLADSSITVADVVSPRDAAQALPDALSQLSLGDCLMVSRQLRRSEIERFVAHRLPQWGRRLEWSGPQLITVTCAPAAVPGSDIATVAAQALTAHVIKMGGQPSLELVHAPEALRVAADAHIEMRVEPASLRLAPRTQVVVRVSNQGKLLRQVPVWFEVRALASGTVAARTLERGTVLAAQDLMPGEIDLAKLKGQAPVATEAWLGLRLSRQVKISEALDLGSTEKTPEVLRGARIALALAHGSVAIKTTGEALSDARLSQHVRVRLARNEVVNAVVTGVSHARLSEEVMR
jgi:flagella basal body P-ring formation protein FlgA